MYIVRIAPLAILPNTVPQVLDYFWTTPLPPGCIVDVVVGRRTLHALVLESLDLARAKLSVKKSDFGLKKIVRVVTDLPQATPQQINLAQWLSHQYFTPLGRCLKTVLPGFIGKKTHLLELQVVSSKLQDEKTKIELMLTQPDTALSEIQKRIRKIKGQILIIVPEIALAEYFTDQLKKYRPIVMHSDLGVRAYDQAYRAVMTGSVHVIIGTRIALFLPFQNLASIIMEDPLHEAYKSDSAPRYNTADVAREVSRLYGAPLTFLSPALSTANYYHGTTGALPIIDHKPHWPKVTMINMRAHGDGATVSKPVMDAIDRALGDNQRILIFSPRRAYAGAARCEHCHASIMCETCDIPMRVHKIEETLLVCYHCSAYRDLPALCPTCGKGRLKASGLAGSQKIASAISDMLKRRDIEGPSVHILDSDLTRTPTQERAVLADIERARQPIVVATQMIFSHRYLRGFDLIVIVQADALVYHPDFRSDERLIYQLEKLADFHPHTMYLQTWEENGVLALTQSRAWNAWYPEELTSRKSLHWPPYMRLASLTYRHRDRRVAHRTAQTLAAHLDRVIASTGTMKSIEILGPAPAFVEHGGGQWTQRILIKAPPSSTGLWDLLFYIGAGWIIDVDPRSIV